MADPMTKVLEPFLAEADAVLDGRYSAVLYGSAARGDYLPDRSDVNLLLLVEDAAPPVLHSLARGFALWRKATPEPPLLMTRLEWTRAADAFPIEIADMKTAYKVLRGPDPIQLLRVEPADLRRALEREFRGKIVRLRQSYAALESDAAALGAVASGSASSVLVLFRVLLVFFGRPVPSDPVAVATEAAAIVGARGEALAHVVRHRRERAWRCPAPEFEAYMQVVAQATDFLDQHSLGDV